MHMFVALDGGAREKKTAPKGGHRRQTLCSNGGRHRQKSLDTRTAPDTRKMAPQKHNT
jgi:hypothetical protein